jgi:hypothetical protein
MDGFEYGMSVDIFYLFSSQRAPSHQGTEIVIQLCVGFKGIKENPVAVIDHTADFSIGLLSFHLGLENYFVPDQ